MFSSIIKEVEEINDSKITIGSFLAKIKQYQNLDDALVNLPSSYIEFLANNDKQLMKAINNLFEAQKTDYDSRETGASRWSTPQEKTIKKIKYKGSIIVLEFDDESGLWDVWTGHRSIVQALKQGKAEVDISQKKPSKD